MRFLLPAAVAAMLIGSAPAYAVDCPVGFIPGTGIVATCPDSAPQRDYRDAVALGIAMGAPTFLGDAEKFALSGAVGAFDEEHAFALTGIARVNKHISVNGGVGFAPATEQFGYRAGVRVGW